MQAAVRAANPRSTRAVALPYPAASVLVRDADGRPTAAVPTSTVRIDHGDLTALLYLQGYTDEDFVR